MIEKQYIVFDKATEKLSYMSFIIRANGICKMV